MNETEWVQSWLRTAPPELSGLSPDFVAGRVRPEVEWLCKHLNMAPEEVWASYTPDQVPAVSKRIRQYFDQERQRRELMKR